MSLRRGAGEPAPRQATLLTGPGASFTSYTPKPMETGLCQIRHWPSQARETCSSRTRLPFP